jgi:hypothetical protein
MSGKGGSSGAGVMEGKIPKGYLPWTGWDPACPVYYPGPDASPVDPVEWLPCDKKIVPSSYECKYMASPWRISGPLLGIGTVKTSRVNGKLRHWIMRNNYYGITDGQMFVVSEDDGPVLASWYGLIKPCAYLYMTPHGSGYGLGIYKKDGSSEGFIMGSYDSAEPVGSVKITDGVPSHFDAVASGPVRMRGAGLWLTPWETKTESKIASSEKGAFAGTHPADDWLVIPIGTSSYGPRGTWLWHPSTGIIKLQYAPNDLTLAWDDYGTDQQDAVWTFRGGKAPEETKYPINDVYTGKFTVDPKEVEATKKRLRKDPFKYPGSSPWVVGCGYAARSVGTSTVVVRLSDGWAWELEKSDTYSFNVNAVTCEDIRGGGIYITGDPLTNNHTYYRIRLDSLGPPTLPPD